MNPYISLKELIGHLAECKTALASLKPKQEAKADCAICDDGGSDSVDLSGVYAYLDSMISYLSSRISDLSDSFWNHTQNGHIPPIIGAGNMSAVLKALGLSGDYDVQKKTIYASNGDISETQFSIKEIAATK